MKRTIRREDIAIECGKESDSLERLEKLCNAEAERLLPTLDVPDETTVEVPCWTAGLGFAELIGVEKFSKDANGKITYELDSSVNTVIDSIQYVN